jgi:hypothetical protein
MSLIMITGIRVGKYTQQGMLHPRKPGVQLDYSKLIGHFACEEGDLTLSLSLSDMIPEIDFGSNFQRIHR